MINLSQFFKMKANVYFLTFPASSFSFFPVFLMTFPFLSIMTSIDVSPFLSPISNPFAIGTVKNYDFRFLIILELFIKSSGYCGGKVFFRN